MSKATESTSWIIDYAPVAAGEKTITLATENKFVDKNIEINVDVAAGAMSVDSSSIEASSNVGILGTASSTQPASGGYIKVEGEAVVEIATAGWLDEGDTQAVTPADVYYPIVNATFEVDGPSVKSVTEGYVPAATTLGTIPTGSQSITGGEMSTSSSSTALASNGLSNGTTEDATKKIALSDTKADGYYELETSGSAVVARADVEKQVTSAGYFAEDSSAVQAIAGANHNVSNAHAKYYVAQSTLSASSVTSSNVQQTVTIGAGYYHEARTVTVEPMASATVAPDTANTGLSTYFNAGTSADNDVSLTPRYSVTDAGYVAVQTNTAGTPEYYKIKTTSVTTTDTTVSGTTATRGTASWGTGWIEADSMGAATFANAATSGTSYVDISGTTDAPVLVAGDYLYINAGYTDNLKISLAKLVPDGSDVKGHAEYILTGHSAYDNDGTLVAGSMQVYDGTYSVA